MIGDNQKVKEVEAKLGAFPFDENSFDKSPGLIVVGPKKLENEATYYGQ
jgi:hypothetical protein